jgi:hypothetical protein
MLFVLYRLHLIFEARLVGPGQNLQLGRQGRPVHDQRVITRHLERRRQPREDPGTGVCNRGCLAVHDAARPYDLSPVRLPDRLMTKTDSQQRGGRTESFYDVDADTCLVRRAWSG